MTNDDRNELLDLMPAAPDEGEVVAKHWPPLEAKILSHLHASVGVPGTTEFHLQDVLERVLGGADDDCPLPDFVARRLPPIAEAVGALLIEVWGLDSRFGWVERLAGWHERGALPRWEVSLAMSGLVQEDTVDWRQSPKIGIRDYEPVRDERATWAPTASRQEVVALFEGKRLLGYVRAVFAQTDGVSAKRTSRLSNLAHALKHAIMAAEWRRIERARDELAHLGNRAADPQKFLGEIVTQFLPRTLAVHAASIFFLNEAGDGLVLAHSTGLEELAGAVNPPIYRRGVGLTGYVWEHNRSLRFPDDLSSKPKALAAYTPAPTLAALSRERLPENTRRQFLAVPLVKDREVIGVLRLGGRTGEWRFSESDEALANAVALQIVQIYSHLRAIEEGIEAKSTLIKTMELLQVAQTEAEMVRTTLIAITRRGGLSFNRAAYWAFDEDCRSLTPLLLVGAATAEEDQLLRTRISGPLEQAVKKANAETSVLESTLTPKFRSLSIPSIDSSEDYLSRVCREPSRNRAAVVDLGEHRESDTRELYGLFRGVEARVIPLWASGSCLGCIYVDNAFDRAPIRKELEEVVLTHARHLAGALKAARESRQRRLAHEFHRKLSSALVAPGDAYSVARGVVAVIHDVLGFEKILVYYHDAGDGVVRLLGRQGFGHLPAIAFQIGKLVNAIVPRVVEWRRPYFTEVSEGDEQIDPEWRELLDLSGPLLAFPLLVGGMITGVLVINDPQVNPGTEFLLRPLADVLGVAVRTIAQEERLEAREKTVNLLSRIQKDLRLAYNEEAFADELAGALVEIIPAQLCAIYRPSSFSSLQDWTTIREAPFERRGSAGYPESLKHAVKYARIGPRAGLTSHVLCKKAVNAPQLDKDERWEGSEFAALTEVLTGKIRAFLGVPLVASNGRVLGAITLTRIRISADDGLAFQRHEQELLSCIAEAVSTVFELKDAQGKLEQQVMKMDALSEINDRLMATAVAVRTHGDLQALSQEIADELRRACGAELVVVYRLGESAPQLSPSLSGDFWRRDALAAPKMETLRTGYRAVGEYFEDAVAAYGGRLPEGSFAEREGVISFAHVRVFGANGDPLICVFINYRTPYRFPAEERKMIERFARTSGLAIEVALRALNDTPRVPGLRVVQGGGVSDG